MLSHKHYCTLWLGSLCSVWNVWWLLPKIAEDHFCGTESPRELGILSTNFLIYSPRKPPASSLRLPLRWQCYCSQGWLLGSHIQTGPHLDSLILCWTISKFSINFKHFHFAPGLSATCIVALTATNRYNNIRSDAFLRFQSDFLSVVSLKSHN